jgi:ABC-type cobalamin/Fe3+-siderophores transport system ATPase subunit
MLQLENLHIILNKSLIIKGITANFTKGKIIGVLGPNGAGKSTLLKAISGIYSPVIGDLFWQQKSIYKKTRAELSQIVTMVPQTTQTYFDFTVHEIVSMGLYAQYHLSVKEKKENLYQAMIQSDLWAFRNRKITSLSCGEKQRVYIARSLATQAPVLLLDEPTASLDIRHQIEIIDVLKKLKKLQKTILLSIHDLNLAQRICDEICVLSRGDLVAQGEYSTVMTDELLFEVFNLSSEDVLNHCNIKYTSFN